MISSSVMIDRRNLKPTYPKAKKTDVLVQQTQ
jgi:hypothetical protein